MLSEKRRGAQEWCLSAQYVEEQWLRGTTRWTTLQTFTGQRSKSDAIEQDYLQMNYTCILRNANKRHIYFWSPISWVSYNSIPPSQLIIFFHLISVFLLQDPMKGKKTGTLHLKLMLPKSSCLACQSCSAVLCVEKAWPKNATLWTTLRISIFLAPSSTSAPAAAKSWNPKKLWTTM